MSAPKSLPRRPSLESLRKQAKRLAREVAGGNAEALARARALLPHSVPPLSQRDAQLVLAREYGFAGWQDLTAEVLKRLGKGIAWAADQAARAIHDNDVERLRQLLTEHPGLVTWHAPDGGVLLQHATSSYAMDVSDPDKERTFTRLRCAELLLDAGATVVPVIWENALNTGALGILQLLWRKGVIPHRLRIVAALGELEAVRACFDESGTLRVASDHPDPRTEANEAFLYACRFRHKPIAAFLLDRCIALNGELDRRIAAWQNRSAFIDYLIENPLWGTYPAPIAPWRAFIMRQLCGAIGHDDLATFSRWLESESDLLDDANVGVQVQLIEHACWTNRGPFIARLLARDPAILRRHPPPPSAALLDALAYGNAHLIPLLTRIWPLPDDLPHAAGVGDFAAVKRWFDPAGRVALGDLNNHYPAYDSHIRNALHWGAPTIQQVLDTAFAWACMNHHFEIAAFLLDHGADIDTDWCTHEPASVLHQAAVEADYELARFLIDHGIDMTIRDHRWNSTAEDWADAVGKDKGMAEFLATAEREREEKRRAYKTPE